MVSGLVRPVLERVYSSLFDAGWSSSIPNYNPEDIVANLKRKMLGEDLVPMEPWYRGFEGTIAKATDKGVEKFHCTGVYSQPDAETIKITELPVKSWTQPYKELIESWTQITDKQPHPLIKDYLEHHTDATVSFTMTLTAAGKEVIKKEGAEKALKLVTSLSVSNMVCFDADGKIKKYKSPEAILEDFYDVRMDYYHKRKETMLQEMGDVLDRLTNQARFVLAIISEELKISKRKKADIVAEMRASGYKPIPKAPKKLDARGPEDLDAGHDSEEEVDATEASAATDRDSGTHRASA
jgi:DNA topoisomerase-2